MSIVGLVWFLVVFVAFNSTCWEKRKPIYDTLFCLHPGPIASQAKHRSPTSTVIRSKYYVILCIVYLILRTTVAQFSANWPHKPLFWRQVAHRDYDFILYNYWLVIRATYDMLDLETKCCPRPTLYYWFRIKYSMNKLTMIKLASIWTNWFGPN